MLSSQCKLCLKFASLRKSHIFPRFLMKPLRNEKGHFVGVNGQGLYGVDILQDGLKENLLCDDCENFCSAEYERPFHRLFLAGKDPILRSPWHADQTLSVAVDYTSFKLFHLLNLWRSSVSDLPSCKFISLGSHEEVLRRMLLSKDPGLEHEYPVSGRVLFDPHTHQIPKLFQPALAFRDGPRRAYRMAYAGVVWTVLVSAGGSPQHRRASLKADGKLVVTGIDWRTLDSVQIAHALVKNKPARTIVAE